MATHIELARKGTITKEMAAVAHAEGIADEYVRDMIATGMIVIPNNTSRKSKVVGIGKGLRTKVNASIGTSSDIVDIDAECRKAKIAEEEGADTLMELSVGGDLGPGEAGGIEVNQPPGRDGTSLSGFLRGFQEVPRPEQAHGGDAL